MSKNVLDEFDKNQAEKSTEEEAVAEISQAETPAPEPEAKPEAPEEEPKGAKGDEGQPGTQAPKPEVAPETPKEPEAPVAEPEAPAEPEVAEKDADEDSDATPSPKPFEKGGKVGEKDADPNGGNAELLSAVTSAFRGNFETVQKSLGENQQSIAQLTETVSAVNKQLDEIRELVTNGFATKSAEPETEAIKAEPEDKEAEKADKSKDKAKDKDEDCDDEDCKDKKDGKEDKDKDSKKDAEKSLDEEVPVAEPVPDEPLYVAEKSAAIGSQVSEVAPEVEETQEEATKSLSEQYVAARGKLGDFNDKLIAEAQVGAITRADYAEKSILADDIAYGREITQEKLDEFVGYIK